MNENSVMDTKQRLGDLALTLWLLVVASAFFAPLTGIALPELSPVYAIVLAAFCLLLALRQLRSAPPQSVPPQSARRERSARETSSDD